VTDTVTIQVRIPADRQHYVESSARIRSISQTQLLRRAMDYVLQDQLLLSILDDGDRPSPKTAPIRNTRNMPFSRVKTPRKMVEDATIEVVHRKTKFNPPATFRARHADLRTRAEMLADLHAAVLNTGGTASE